MPIQRVSEFAVWQAGYAGAVVRIEIGGTNDLAPLYYDEGATEVAPNPQALATLVDASGQSYGMFLRPVYTTAAYTLAITSTGETGVQRPALTSLTGEDASSATVQVAGSSATRTLAQIVGRVIFAEDYGTFGPSAATNTTAIAAAIGKAAAQGGGVVMLPAGVIQVSGLTLPEAVVLRGAGRGVTVLQSQLGGKSVIIGGNRAGLEALTLDGVAIPPTSIGIYMVGRQESVLRNVEVKRFEVGIRARGGKNHAWRDLFVSDCPAGVQVRGDKATDETTPGGVAQGFCWDGGAITLCRDVGVEIGYEDEQALDNTLRNVRVASNLTIGVRLNGARGTSILDCSFDDQPTHLAVRDDDDTGKRELNTVERLSVTGGSFTGGKITVTGTADGVVFRGVAFKGEFEMALDVPIDGVVSAVDCIEADTFSITGDGTKWSRFETRGDSSVFGLTTGATATQAWSTTMKPGETINAEATVVANQRNAVNRAVYELSCGAYRPGSTLAYDGQTEDFSLGDVINGTTSKASARLIAQTDSGGTGTLTLRSITGAFLDNEEITGEAGGTAFANGLLSDQNAALDSTGNVYRRAYETNANWNAIFAVSGGELRLNVTGASSADIEWQVRVRTTRI